jgi:hypothetical protein
MYIYKQELQDCLRDAILEPANCKATAYCQIITSDNPDEDIKKAVSNLQSLNGSISDIDLYPIKTILVTTGTNKNDDVFERDETWAARHTPEHKPFDIEHDHSKIIGHIVSSKGVDKEYKDIPDDTSLDGLPEKFHLLTDAVIYKCVSDFEMMASEIESGQWFVSMECLFNNFDYLKVASNGAREMVKRDDKTAYLTKHLRIYGGTGSYNGDTYYRVLRNLVFSGKGLVKNPANPESVIFNTSGVYNPKEINDMSKELEQQIADLQSQIAEKDKSFAELQATQETTAQTVAGLITERDEFKASVETLTAAKVELETQLASKTEEYVASIAKAAELQSQLVKVGRMILAIDKGLEKDEASVLIEKWSTLSDEQFVDILDLASAAKTKKEMTPEEMKKQKMMDEKKKSKADEDIEIDVVGEQVAEITIIEEKVETEVTPIAEPEVDKMIAVRANLQEYLSSVLGVK